MTNSILLLSPQRVDPARQAAHLEHLRAIAEADRVRSRPVPGEAEIRVRALSEGDRGAIAALAGRDSAEIPHGDLLGAEIDGRLVAILALEDGTVVADPFLPTAPAAELLRLRARQLGADGTRRRFPRLRRVPRARGALAGSPPGSGRLLQL